MHNSTIRSNASRWLSHAMKYVVAHQSRILYYVVINVREDRNKFAIRTIRFARPALYLSLSSSPSLVVSYYHRAFLVPAISLVLYPATLTIELQFHNKEIPDTGRGQPDDGN